MLKTVCTPYHYLYIAVHVHCLALSLIYTQRVSYATVCHRQCPRVCRFAVLCKVMYLSGCTLLLVYGFAPVFFLCRFCIVALTGNAGRFTATSVSYPRIVGLLFRHQAEQLTCFVRFGCRLSYSVYIRGLSGKYTAILNISRTGRVALM